MGSVRIDSGPPAAWQRPCDIPKDKWFFLMEEKRSFISTNIPYDCRCLLEFVQDANEMWEELGFKSAEDMILNGYELDPVEVDLAYEWLSIQSPETAVDYETAVEGVRKAAIERVLRLLPKLSKEEIKEVQSRLSEMI
jgi:hypothetical protein